MNRDPAAGPPANEGPATEKAGPALAIRRADPGDAETVIAIVQRAYEGYIESIGVRPVPLDADHSAAIRRGEVFVAAQDRIVGIIELVVEPGHVLIENVAVDPAAQHRGTGRALLAFAERVARERGLTAVRLYTHREMRRNQGFYEQLGFDREAPPPGDETPRVFFVKRLR